MYYSQLNKNLFLINLDQKIEGFRNFVSSWLYKDRDTAFLIDPGPIYSIDVLKESLNEIGIKKLDYILLTHIHIDHAGGTGELLKNFPDTKIICPEKGIKHLINPAKLWQGSLNVLGEVAMAYGEISAVPQDRFCNIKKIKTGGDTIEIIETPGHAAHHNCYIFKEYLFAGEVAGVCQPLLDKIYTRPATPPKFILEIWLNSLNKVIERKPSVICYGHYGTNNNALQALHSSKEQIFLWIDVIKEQMTKDAINIEEGIIENLMKKDRLFSNYKYLDNDIKKRESFFIKNSIKGIIKYFEMT